MQRNGYIRYYLDSSCLIWNFDVDIKKTLVQKLNSIFFVGKYNGENYFCWIGPLSLSPTLKQNVPKIKEFLSIENEAWWILKMEMFDFQRKILMYANINWSSLKF